MRVGTQRGWVPKNWSFHIVALEMALESPLLCKIKPINPEGNQPWMFIGRIDVEAEAPILWPPDAKSWLTGKDSDAGKDWKQKEGRQRMRKLDRITNSMDVNLSKVWAKSGKQWKTEELGPLQCMRSQSWTQLSDWWPQQQQYTHTEIWFFSKVRSSH